MTNTDTRWASIVEAARLNRERREAAESEDDSEQAE